MVFSEWLENAKRSQKENDNFDFDKTFEEWFLDKYDNDRNKLFSDWRLARFLVYEMPEIERINGENRRWSRSVQSILEIGGRYFGVTWEEGLTEMQENEFYCSSIIEVQKVTKTIVVTEWEEKK